MSVVAIVPGGHTKPIGKYAPGVRVAVSDRRALVFVSGQVASDQDGNTIGAGDPTLQTEAVFANLRRVLQAAGGDLRDLVSVTIYLRNIDDFAAVSSVRNRVLADPPPSSTLVEVSRLAVSDHLVEISAVACVSLEPELR